ncbi:hypothetical protein DPMN_177440 [Dreissena polymorpha]|uniref:Uncharacterized protein n=1 Tax=Dreissena polymorpha TaxID=45954 RepID=A0A9D4IK71_DREPO|nr:hypothetical protein DPMN_177440 [Dreissena polymorpha]
MNLLRLVCDLLAEDQILSMGKVLFCAIKEGPHPSLGFLRHGVLPQNGRLILPLTGTYLIYSSFHHRLQCSLSGKHATADETPLARHAMYRFNIRLGIDQELATTLTAIVQHSLNLKLKYLHWWSCGPVMKFLSN